MDAAPHCIACNVKRTLISISPAPNRHEMRSFECHKCRTVLRLVAALPEPSPVGRMSG
jgi:hypothetical protein